MNSRSCRSGLARTHRETNCGQCPGKPGPTPGPTPAPGYARWLVLLLSLCITTAASASTIGQDNDAGFWPTGSQLLRVLLLRDYNTRVVVSGATLLGIAAGVIGSFMLLRKRALMGDALSHATLPGITLAFVIMASAGGTGKALTGLLLGAAASGVLGVAAILVIQRFTRLKEDAALGIVLSVFFGIGMAMLGIIQQMEAGHAAGLEAFIYGKTASMLARDAQLIAGSAVVVLVLCALLFKELKALCFDAGYAASQGFAVFWLDLLMMALVTAVTVIGLQAVGLILVIALLIIPAAAARFWTESLGKMVPLAGALGALSGWLGASLSALTPRLPAGAIIVVVASAVFLFSLVFGTARGALRRWIERHLINRRISRQHVLRALYELLEEGQPEQAASAAELLSVRSWSASQLTRLLQRVQREGLVYQGSDGRWRFTEEGRLEGQRICRNHRLWEMYLIHYADVAASQVDRDADRIEHVLGVTLVRRLEELLDAQQAEPSVPASPHPLVTITDAGGQA